MTGKKPIVVQVNGKEFTREVEPRKLLVHFLREDLGLTGTHVGCVEGKCGACTVLVDGVSAKSCLMLAVQAHASEIMTVEGLSKEGQLHILQRAFSEKHGLQCGYCTPGMLLASYALLMKNPKPSQDEIKRALSGNICRCTGYQGIIEAVTEASEIDGQV